MVRVIRTIQLIRTVFQRFSSSGFAAHPCMFHQIYFQKLRYISENSEQFDSNPRKLLKVDLNKANQRLAKFHQIPYCNLKDKSQIRSALQQRFIQSLSKLDAFLKTQLSSDSEDARLFLDSNRMTLADCNLLPKLHIALTAARYRRNFQLPEVGSNFFFLYFLIKFS